MEPGTSLEIPKRSTYLKYLPSLYERDEFLGRFLMIFEDILQPLEGMVDQLPYYFAPEVTTEERLPWLAGWVDLELDENWPLEKRRALVKSAVELWQWRGTRRGLTQHLRVYAGVDPKITEDIGGIPLGEGARLGWNTVLGGGSHHVFHVVLEVDDVESVDAKQIEAIIESEKPAHTIYTLEIVPRAATP